MLGARIAHLRKIHGMSQCELASRINVSTSALGMYEQNRREPSLAVLIKLAQELNATTDYLLTGALKQESILQSHSYLKEINSITLLDQLLQQQLSKEEIVSIIISILEN